MEPSGASRVLERVATRRGELVLRRSGTEFEIISNGVFLMDTRDGRSERLMVTAALARCPATAPEVLICGLGVGFALAEAVSQARVTRVDVVEISARSSAGTPPTCATWPPRPGMTAGYT